MDLKTNLSEISRVRSNGTWRLLAADKGEFVIALLKTLLYDDMRFKTIQGSILALRVADSLEILREGGFDFPGEAAYYLARWVNEGYLIRRFPQGASEEEYELSAASIDAIRFAASLANPVPAMTESRLALVIQAVSKLSDDTDPDTGRRIQRLQEDIDRRQAELELVKSGHLGVLPKDAAKERVNEIAALAEGLIDDFRRVMDEFERLARTFREQVHASDQSRGEVLEEFFKGYLTLDNTDAGRTFSAFYKLLNDDVQQNLFRISLKRLEDENFFQDPEPQKGGKPSPELEALQSGHEPVPRIEGPSKGLTPSSDSGESRKEEEAARSQDYRQARLLANLVQDLVSQASAIAKVTSALDESLRQFVEGPEYLRSKALAKLLLKAQSLALSLKDSLSPVTRLETRLNLSARKLRSVSQLVWDPKPPRTKPDAFRPAEGPPPDLSEFWKEVNIAEIDFRTLKEDVLAVLGTRDSASVAEILTIRPARQGLASVVGLIHLAHRHGERVSEAFETAAWIGGDGGYRNARIDMWRFLKQCAKGLQKDYL